MWKESRKTATRYFNVDSFPEHAGRPTLPDPLQRFVPQLQQRLADGPVQVSQLIEEIRAHDYSGSDVRVYRWVMAYRPSTPSDAAGPCDSSISSIKPKPLSASRAAWLLVQPPPQLTVAEQAAIDVLDDLCPELKLAHDLVQDFRTMLRERKAEHLTDWLQRTIDSGLTDLRNFAIGLKRDFAAVRAALSLPWNNGRTEGHVNRLKLLKRQMYGRAKLDLLRKRVLHAA